MKNEKAIVTIVIGEKYDTNWKSFCKPNWERYAEKYGFDLICIDHPLDISDRANKRSAAWQKCLILGQNFSDRYERIVWADSDIIINACAPDVTEGVPPNKVGVVEDQTFSHLAFLRRAFNLWPEAVINYTPQEYYRNYGLPGDCDKAFNSGVMVLSPQFHRSVLEHVYNSYEEKGGREWHMEQRPLSYELVKAGRVHWLDPRFNVLWGLEEIANYPFLRQPPEAKSFRARMTGKIQNVINGNALAKLRADAINTVFQSSFFIHFAGKMEEMHLVRHDATSWWDILS